MTFTLLVSAPMCLHALKQKVASHHLIPSLSLSLRERSSLGTMQSYF